MGNGSDKTRILSRLEDVRATDDDDEESAPSITKSRPTTPMSVSWPAAEEVTATGQQSAAAISEMRRMVEWWGISSEDRRQSACQHTHEFGRRSQAADITTCPGNSAMRAHTRLRAWTRKGSAPSLTFVSMLARPGHRTPGRNNIKKQNFCSYHVLQNGFNACTLMATSCAKRSGVQSFFKREF